MLLAKLFGSKRRSRPVSAVAARTRHRLAMESLEQRLALAAMLPPNTNFFEVDITNNTPNANLFVSLVSKTQAYKFTQYQDSNAKTVYLAEVDSSPGSSVASVPLSSLTNEIDGTYGFYVPVYNGSSTIALTGGRIYFADQANAVSFSGGKVLGISPTAGFDWDMVEFTVDAATNQLNLDTTQVDQFGMPIFLQVTPIVPDFANGTGIVSSDKRSQIIQDFKTYTGAGSDYTAYAGVSPASSSAIQRLLAPQHVIDADNAGTTALQESFDESLYNFFNYYYTGTGGGGHTLYLMGNGANGPELFSGNTIKTFQAQTLDNPSATGTYTVMQFTGTGYIYNGTTNTLTQAVTGSPSAAGQSTGGNTGMTLNGTGWTSNQFQPGGFNAQNVYSVTITSGTGAGQTRQISSNTATTLQVSSSWSTIPDNTSQYKIQQFYGGATYEIYYPYFNGNLPNSFNTGLSSTSNAPLWFNNGAGNLNLTSAGRMVFGASGVFADDKQQLAYYKSNPPSSVNTNFDHKMLGNLENQVVTQMNRGVTPATGSATMPNNMQLRIGSNSANDLIYVDLTHQAISTASNKAPTGFQGASTFWDVSSLVASGESIVPGSVTGTIFYNDGISSSQQTLTVSYDVTNTVFNITVGPPTNVIGPPPPNFAVGGKLMQDSDGRFTKIIVDWNNANNVPSAMKATFTFSSGPTTNEAHYATLHLESPYSPSLSPPSPTSFTNFVSGDLGPSSNFSSGLKGATSPAQPTTGMTMTGISLNNPTYLYQVKPGSDVIVHSPQSLKGLNTNILTFSTFYPVDNNKNPIGAFNAYASFFHIGDPANGVPAPTVDGKGYAFAYDDNGGYSSDITVNLPSAVQSNPVVTKLALDLLPWGSVSTTSLGTVSGDFNNDGLTDIADMKGSGDWEIAISQSGGDPIIVTTTSPWATSGVTWGDFKVIRDPSTNRDVVIARAKNANEGGWWKLSLAGNGPYTINQPEIVGSWGFPEVWVDIVTGDFDGDTKPDIAGRWDSTGEWWILKDAATPLPAVTLPNVQNKNVKIGQWNPLVTWENVVAGKFNSTAPTDLIAGRVDSDWWLLTPGESSPATIPMVTGFSLDSPWLDAVVGNFNGSANGKQIAVRHQGTGQWHLIAYNGSTYAASFMTHWSSSVTWHNVGVADGDGDGKDEIAGQANSSYHWWMIAHNGSSFGSTDLDAGQVTKPAGIYSRAFPGKYLSSATLPATTFGILGRLSNKTWEKGMLSVQSGTPSLTVSSAPGYPA